MSKQKTEQAIEVAWQWRDEAGIFGVLRVGKKDHYLVEKCSTLVYRVTKLEPSRATTYTVILGKTFSCGCESFSRHQTCRHIEALLGLRSEGKL